MAGAGESSSLEVFCRSLVIVGVAELFDKTWFMGLLLALRYRAVTVFTGSVSALLLHTVLAAMLGYAFAKLLSPMWLNLLAAALFAAFALLYTKDWYFDDPDGDAIATGREEAAEEVDGTDGEESEGPPHNDTGGKAHAAVCEERASGEGVEAKGVRLMEDGDAESEATPRGKKQEQSECLVFSKSFTAVFIAEWGDRTQIAMVGQHASQPLVPVFLGSAVAFCLLTLSAVLAAAVLAERKLSSRLVHGISAIFFALFAVLALRDAWACRAPAA